MTAVPGHLAIIMDGNGRWAERRGRPRWFGHAAGARAVRRIVEHAARRGVRQLTLYAFSSDNWKRSPEEVSALMELFMGQLKSQAPRLVREGIRLEVIGRRDRLAPALRGAIVETERRTAGGRRMHLRVAVDYSSRAAIQASLATGAPASDARVTHEASEGVGRHIASHDRAVSDADPGSILPPVDLLLRTGGERRLSDFLLWECAYAELAFSDVLWPDMTTEDLDAAIADFASRERRFGAAPAAATSTAPAARASA